MTVIDERLLRMYEAVRDTIRAIPGFYGCEIGEAPAPKGTDEVPGFPYSVLYPIPWDFLPSGDAPAAFQVSTVGANAVQSIYNAGRVRRLLMEEDPVTGEYVTPIEVPALPNRPPLVVMMRQCTTAGGLEPGTAHSAIDRFVFFMTSLP